MDVLRSRLAAQLLTGSPAASVGAVVDRMLAVQAQDARAARLGVRARSTALRSSDVDDALDRRELVITTLNRGTLHLVHATDYPWLHALTTPQLVTGNARRLREEGVSPAQAERGVVVLERELTDGPRTRSQLKAALDAAGVPTARQALAHVVFAATLRGLVVRGPVVDGEHAFVLVRDWLPPAAPVDRDVALGELARRYLTGHGPSSDRDLATWAGIGLRDARAGLRRAGATGSDLVVLPGADTGPVPAPSPRLLGPWDELLMGWVDRTPVLADHRSVITKNGIFRAIAVVEGRAVGTWRLVRDRVALEPFAPLPDDVVRALEQDAADVERFVRGKPAPSS